MRRCGVIPCINVLWALPHLVVCCRVKGHHSPQTGRVVLLAALVVGDRGGGSTVRSARLSKLWLGHDVVQRLQRRGWGSTLGSLICAWVMLA
jgi:hypothetical protein